MKVVIFCGGFGTRLREFSETIPKPLVNIGYRPILWHLMSYYAHFGHKHFILCLGYRGDLIRQYFLDYRAAMSTDFTLSDGGRRIELHGAGIDDWRIDFVDTGMHSHLGERLRRVSHLVENDEMFLANYSDGLTDLPLDEYVSMVKKSGATAGLVAVRPSQNFHGVQCDADGVVTEIEDIAGSDFWINGGFFCFRSDIFSYICEGEELVEAPFKRLVGQGKLFAYKYRGFWAAMDTFKDKIKLDRLEALGDSPWLMRNPPSYTR